MIQNAHLICARFLEYHGVKCWIAFLLGFKYIRRYVKSLTNSMLKLDGIES